LLSNSQSLLNDDEGEDEEIDDDDNELENENKISIETSNEDKFVQAIDRFIQYQKQNEVKISVFFFHMNFHQLYSFDRIVGINILNNKLIWNYNVDKKIEHINYN